MISVSYPFIVAIEEDSDKVPPGDHVEWLKNPKDRHFNCNGESVVASSENIAKEVKQWETYFEREKLMTDELRARYSEFTMSFNSSCIIFCLFKSMQLLCVATVMFDPETSKEQPAKVFFLNALLLHPKKVFCDIPERVLNVIKFFSTTTLPACCPSIRFEEFYVLTGKRLQPFWEEQGFSQKKDAVSKCNTSMERFLFKLFTCGDDIIMSFVLKATCSNSQCRPFIGQRRLKTCSVCRIARYCSKECQQTDWPKHKLECTKK